jgi:hypothetical protein
MMQTGSVWLLAFGSSPDEEALPARTRIFATMILPSHLVLCIVLTVSLHAATTATSEFRCETAVQ